MGSEYSNNTKVQLEQRKFFQTCGPLMIFLLSKLIVT